MASRKIEDLDPRVQEGARAILKAWEDLGIDVVVTTTFRSNEEQDRLYAQGRNGHPGPIVTNARAGQSLHNRGLAMDIVPLVNGKAMWDPESPLWRILWQSARLVDPRVSWGGTWPKFKDRPHYEWLLRKEIGEEVA
jgi:peptidoglycan L-alanyl-D-glutamate endopeptidase CwlK